MAAAQRVEWLGSIQGFFFLGGETSTRRCAPIGVQPQKPQ